MQLLAEELAGLRVQLLDGVKVPELLVVKETVPVGLVGVEEVSVTVAVHWAAWLTATDPWSHVRIVLVA